MLRHIVWWTMKDEAEGASGAENAAKMLAMLQNLKGRIPTLKDLEVTTTFLEITTEPVQILLQSTHDDGAGLKAYAEHPAHLDLVELVKAVVDSRQSIDFEV